MALTKLDPNVIGQDSTGAGKITSAGGSVSIDSSGAVRIANATSNSVTVTANGFVGVLEPTPDVALHVSGAANGPPANTGSTPAGFISLRRKTAGATHGLNMGVTGVSPYGSWLQAQDAGNLATNYPLSLNPNGGNIGIGTLSPNYSLDIGSRTDAVLLPSGTTAQRPTGTAGAIRFNTTLKGLDFYDGGQWNNINYSDPLYTSTKVLIKNGSLTDASNSRRTLTNGGGASKSSSVGFPGIVKGTSITGSSGSVWYVDSNSSNAYVSFASPFSDFDMGQSAWTLEFWAYIPSGGSSYGHTFWCGGQTSQGEVKYAAADGKFYIYSGAGSSIMLTSYTFNAWNWVVFERYNGTISVWLNGVRQAQSTTMPTGGTPSIAAIGYPFNAEYHGHYLDEVRWTTAARYLGAPSIPVQTTSWPEQ